MANNVNQRPQDGFNRSQPFFFPKITSESEIKRPDGYTLPGLVAMSVTAQADDLVATGYGEGPREIAREKAISEAYERLALFKFRTDSQIKESSSGWAAHRSIELSIQSALFELIERDVAISNWENGGPFYLVPETLWPKHLVFWKQQFQTCLEFSNLRVLLSSRKNGACISVLLFNEKGNFVAGHASALQLEDAIISAANECFRAAHSAIQFEYFTDVIALHSNRLSSGVLPGAHSLAYAYRETMPEIVQIVNATEKEIISLWERHQNLIKNTNFSDLDTQIFQVGDRFVARVKNPKLRQIFWGRVNDLSKRNQYPHFVG